MYKIGLSYAPVNRPLRNKTKILSGHPLEKKQTFLRVALSAAVSSVGQVAFHRRLVFLSAAPRTRGWGGGGGGGGGRHCFLHPKLTPTQPRLLSYSGGQSFGCVLLKSQREVDTLCEMSNSRTTEHSLRDE